jgi:N-acetylneuraminic acid mutarotase
MRFASALAIACVLAACGDDGGGEDGGRDGSLPDRDADGTDAGDAGGPEDGGAPTDAGDSSIPADAGELGIGSWEERGRLIEPNSECAVAELDGKIYVVGGYPADRVSVDTVQVYDVATDAWDLTTPLPQAINHTVAAAANGRVYVIGGQTESSGEGSYVDDVYEYDPATTMWTPRAPMPTARSAGAAAVIDGLIYVAGGRPPQGQDFAVYDPVGNSWEALPPMPTGRNHLAVGAIGGRIYVAGGRFGGGFSSELTDVLEIYDPATRSWSAGAPMLGPRSGTNGIAVGGCFYVWGGESTSGVDEENEAYHAATDSWRALAPLPTPVHGVTGAAHIDGLIYAPGGGTAVGGSSGSRLFQVFRTAGTCPD